jgi:hypothetical protein
MQQIQIQITDTTASIDALELAIDTLQACRDNGQLTFQYADSAITELQMMLVAYRLIQRNAAKEQRKGRANSFNGQAITSHSCIGCPHD